MPYDTEYKIALDPSPDLLAPLPCCCQPHRLALFLDGESAEASSGLSLLPHVDEILSLATMPWLGGEGMLLVRIREGQRQALEECLDALEERADGSRSRVRVVSRAEWEAVAREVVEG